MLFGVRLNRRGKLVVGIVRLVLIVAALVLGTHLFFIQLQKSLAVWDYQQCKQIPVEINTTGCGGILEGYE